MMRYDACPTSSGLGNFVSAGVKVHASFSYAAAKILHP